jgi:hypothetical protein
MFFKKVIKSFLPGYSIINGVKSSYSSPNNTPIFLAFVIKG